MSVFILSIHSVYKSTLLCGWMLIVAAVAGGRPVVGQAVEGSASGPGAAMLTGQVVAPGGDAIEGRRRVPASKRWRAPRPTWRARSPLPRSTEGRRLW